MVRLTLSLLCVHTSALWIFRLVVDPVNFGQSVENLHLEALHKFDRPIMDADEQSAICLATKARFLI
jgi:hypothetical protein